MSNDTSIAIIGLAGRFPKAADIEAFWENLRAGHEGLTFFTDAELAAAGVSPEEFNHPDYVRGRSVLENVDLFDADFFGYSGREAEWMDPQQRIFLEQAHAALEHGGYACRQDPLNVGVFAGCSTSSYLLLNLLPSGTIDAGIGNMQVMIGNEKDFLASRTSYKLNLSGPSMAVQTACSTSLTAVHVACQSLLGGECEMALAGGVCVSLPQVTGYQYQIGSIASPDGHCRPFDAAAKGTNGGSGVGVVLLKRLPEALADGDSIYAIIRGSAINNDGNDKVGYTAPSQRGQAAVIAEALAVAGVSAADIGYIEAHGTATPVGDPIEVAALTQAFRQSTDRSGYCALGSVKANVGHLDAAAGITGLIKTVQALAHGQIPVAVNYHNPNPKIRFDQSPFYVPTQTIEWPSDLERPRRAGVSSFGIGGSNVHVVLEEANESARQPSQGAVLLVFSARSANALASMRENFANFLEKHPDTSLVDAAYTLQIGRSTHAFRHAVVAHDVAEAIALLRAPAQAVHAFATGVALLFTGQGTPLLNIGRALYDTEKTFREAIDTCSQILEPHLGLSITSLLYPLPGAEAAAEQSLASTRFAQPALLSLEYALVRTLTQYGVEPKALLGHSLGQYCAAVIGGIFSLHDALVLIAHRGELMEALDSGVMLAVQLSASDALLRIAQRPLDLAADNGPDSCVLAGPEAEIARLENELTVAGVAHRRSSVNRAFHSQMTEACLAALANAISERTRSPSALPIVCNVTGLWLSDADACDPRYWARHTRETVRFREGLQTLSAQSDLQWLEIGPAPVLTGLARRNKLAQPGREILTFSGHGPNTLLNCLGQLWEAGLAVNWKALARPHQQCRRIGLPTYPFERKRYWVEAPNTSPVSVAGNGNLQPSQDALFSSLHVPRWVPVAVRQRQRPFEQVLFFDPQNSQSEALLEALKQRQADVVRVTDLKQLPLVTTRQWDAIIYAWPLTHTGTTLEVKTLETSFYAFLDVAKALAKQVQQKSATLFVLTRHGADALPTDLMDPFQAAIVGAAREIPREVLWLHCRCIDVTPQTSAAEIIAEFFDEQEEYVVALRAEQRLIWSMQPLLKSVNTQALPLKKDGVYWIIGGTGGVGMAVARYLGKHYQAKLALSSRHAGIVKHEAATLPISWLKERFETLDTNSGIVPIIKRGNLAQQLTRYCSSLAYEYFLSSSLPLQSGAIVSRGALQKALQVKPEFVKFLNFMIELLIRTGNAQDAAEGLRLQSSPIPSQAMRAELLLEHPEFKGMLDFLQHCAAHYPKVLSGQISGVGVLYPDGTAQRMSEAVAQTAEHSSMGTQLALLADWCQKMATEAAGRPLRLLEVGGGHGMLTDAVLAQLGEVEYWFTDIGRSFIDRRRRLAQEVGEQRLVCETFDITRDPLPQGFKHAQFDWILAMNVVHATPDIEQTLVNLRTVLKPGGGLILLETIRQEDWVDMVWGLTPGWWAFSDNELRETSPLLPPDKWASVLTKAGFADFCNVPAGDSTHDAALMVARRPLETAQEQANIQADVAELEALGAQVHLLAVDVADEPAMRRAHQDIEARLGALNGVINCGMVLEDSLLPHKTRAQAKRVLHPKALGTRVLDRVLQDTKLDFLALFSSLSAFDPGPGQFDYAASNAIIDAYARTHRQATRQVLSINWNRWRESGFVARLAQTKRTSQGSLLKRLVLNTATQWELSEHRINGVALLSGTALIEIVVKAALEHGLPYPIQLNNIQFVSPCFVTDAEQSLAYVRLQPTGTAQQFDFEIELANQTACNVFGSVQDLKNFSVAAHHDVEAWHRECIHSENHGSEGVERPPTLGPRWHCLRSANFNIERSKAIAHIILDDAFLADLSQHPLHPALLDVATGFACSGSYLPFGMRSLVMTRALPARFYSLVTLGKLGNDPLLDITLVDEQGQELMRIEGYLLRPPKRNQVLRLGELGHLSTLSLRNQAVVKLEPDDVEISVIAAGLNFKDVLLASGMLAAYHQIPPYELIFGTECAGRITRLGQRAAKQWQIGDSVIASAPGALADSVVVNSRQVFSKPTKLSYAEAATLPTAFATAYYALNNLGHIQAGQRVLIHSATGGVGLAAVQIAQRAGAEIFATAGSQAKRDYLRALGIAHVMDSRNLDFVQYVKETTAGKGVDLVLNALPGDYLVASLNLVTPGGVFLELGKRDIQAGHRLPLEIFDKGIGFISIDYSPEHTSYMQVMNALITEINQGTLRPLPLVLYALSEAPTAFQYMQESRHIGKIIFAPEPRLAELHHLSLGTLQTTLQEQTVSDDLTDEEGLRVLTFALQSREPQIAVLRQGSSLVRYQADDRAQMAEAAFPVKQPFDSQTRVPSNIVWENSTQQKLAEIWQNVLGQDVSGPESHFFDLRGDSLLAISVLGKIRQQFNVTLDPSVIFTAPTLRELAALIEPGDAAAPIATLPATLIPLSRGGSKTPLFLTPPIMGTFFPYLQLAQLLGAERPIYGLSLKMSKTGDFPWKTVEDQARCYISDIRAAQPNGPYLIAGWSFGAAVAFEIVRQLEADGQEIALFAPIDYPARSSATTALLDLIRFFGFSTLSNLFSYLRDYVYLRSQATHDKTRGKQSSFFRNLIQRAVIAKVLSPEAQQSFSEQPDMSELMQFYRANTVALAQYKPTRTYQGRIDVFRTDDHNMKRHNTSLEWETMTYGQVQVHQTSGTHMTVLRSPHVEQLSTQINDRLKQIEDIN